MHILVYNSHIIIEISIQIVLIALIQQHCPAIHRKQIDVTFSACMRCVGMGFGTFHLKSMET